MNMTSSEKLFTTAGQATGVLVSPVDGGALLGSFAGAALYAVNVKETSAVKRLLNMLISMIIGYFSSEWVSIKFGIHNNMISAMLVSALIVFALGFILENAEGILERFVR